MNAEKLKMIEGQVRIGGKGTPRRKHKRMNRPPVVHQNRLQSTLQKLSVTNLQGIQQVGLKMKDGSQLVMIRPKVQCNLSSKLCVFTGEIAELFTPEKRQTVKKGSEIDMIIQRKLKALLIDFVEEKKDTKKQRIRQRPRNKAWKLAKAESDNISKNTDPNEPKNISNTLDQEQEENCDSDDDTLDKTVTEADDSSETVKQAEEETSSPQPIEVNENVESNALGGSESENVKPEVSDQELLAFGDNLSQITISTGTDEEFQDAFSQLMQSSGEEELGYLTTNSDEQKSQYEDTQTEPEEQVVAIELGDCAAAKEEVN